MNSKLKPRDKEDIIERIEAIIDSTMIFRHSAEGKAVCSLLDQLRASTAPTEQDQARSSRPFAAPAGQQDASSEDYRAGWRDGMQEAQELMFLKTLANPAPTAWIATDLDGRADVAWTKEEAKSRAGEGCTEFIPLYDLPDVVAAPQPAARVPVPDGPHFANDGSEPDWNGYAAAEDEADLAEMVNRFLAWPLPVGMRPDIDRPIGTHLMNADQARAMLEYVLARRCRAQGGETKANSGELNGAAPIAEGELPPLPEMLDAADLAYVLETPVDWDEDYRKTWQSLQVADCNRRQWRSYALQLRAALASRPAAREAARQSIDTPYFRNLAHQLYMAGVCGGGQIGITTALIAHIDTWGGAAEQKRDSKV